MAMRSRPVLIGLGVVVLLIIIAVISIPLFVNADTFRTRIESTLSSALGRKVTLGKLNLSVWSGSLVAQNAAIADDPAFSNQPFLQAALVKIHVEVLPLLLSRTIHIKGFTLEAPKITLLRAPNGVWNYSNIGGGGAPGAGKGTGGMIPNLTVGAVDVSEGQLIVGTAPGASAAANPAVTRVYNQLSLNVKNFSFAKSFPFSAAAQLPDAGSVSISGAAGPVNPEDASLTPFTVHLEIKHLNPVAAGMLDASSGISGLIDGIDVDTAWSGKQLHVTKLLVDSPRLAILRAATPSPAAVPPVPPVPPVRGSIFTTLAVDSLQVTNGVITVATPGQPRAIYQQVNARITNFSPTAAAPFTLSAQLPGGGSLNSSGTAGPLNRQNAAATPIDAQISLKNVDLAKSGVVAPGSGVGGLLNLETKATSDGHTLNANGVAHVTALRLAQNGSPAPQPVDLRFAVSQNMQPLTGQIQHSTVTLGTAVVNIAGSYQTVGTALVVNLKVDAPGVSIDQLQAFLPAAGIHLPPGSRLQGGSLTASLNIAGPLANPVISGPVRLDNTQLTGFDLGSKLSSISALTGIRPGSVTAIRSLSMNLRVANGATRTDNLVLVAPALGAVTGSGTVAANGALDYHVVLKAAALSGTGAAGAAGTGGIAGQLMGMIPGGAAKSIGGLAGNVFKNGIPLDIGGTTANPTFAPNLSGALGGAGRGAPTGAKPSGATKSPSNSVGNALGGLLNGHR